MRRALLILFVLSGLSAVAGKRYWVGNGTSFNWNNTSNWSSSSSGVYPGGASVPGSSDTVYFNGGRKCIINASVNIKRLDVGSTFTDTIVQNKYSILIGTTGLSFAGGKFFGDSLDITVNGNYSLSGGYFRSTKTNFFLKAASYSYTGGTFDANNGTFRFESTSTITGSTTFYNLRFHAQVRFATQTFTISSGTILTVNGTLSLTGQDAMLINTGSINCHGDLLAANTHSSVGGSATVNIVGSGSQTLTGSGIVGNSSFPNVTVNKSSGTLTLSSIISVKGNWSYVQGTVDAFTGSSTIAMTGSANVSCQGTSSTMEFYNFRVHSGTTTLTGDLKVKGTLTIASGTTLSTTTQAVTVSGAWDKSGTFNYGTGTVTFDGTGVKQIKGSSSSTFYNLSLTGTGLTTLQRDVTVNNVLDLQNSSFSLDTLKLTLANTSTQAISVNRGYINNSSNGKVIRSTASNNGYRYPLGFTTDEDSVEYISTIIYPGKSSSQSYSVWLSNSNRGLSFSYDKTLYGTGSSTTDLEIINTGYDTLRLKIDIDVNGNVSALRVYNRESLLYETIDPASYTLSNGNTVTFSSVYGLLAAYSQVKASLDRNWAYSIEFGEGNIAVGEGIQYYDFLGRPEQVKSRNFTENTVITVQSIYDRYSRTAIQTLPAPTGNTFSYTTNFIKSSGSSSTYNYTNFDEGSKVNSPDAVAVSSLLGKHYSTQSSEAFIPTSSYPYVRQEYQSDESGLIKRAAAAGDEFRMGSGHEVRSFSMSTGDELKFVYGYTSGTPNSFKCTIDGSDKLVNTPLALSGGILASKTISVDEEGMATVSYTWGGQVLATCISGEKNSCSMSSVTNVMKYKGTRSTDIHLPKENKASLELPLPTYLTPTGSTVTVSATDITYVITDLNTNTVLVSGTDYLINTDRTVTFYGAHLTSSSFLRISFNYSTSLLNSIPREDVPDASVVYDLDYNNWSINLYDLAGRLRKSVSPKGFDCSTAGVFTEAITYDYSSKGELIARRSADEGTIQYVYDSEGKVRFVQDAQQAIDNKFGYVCYDQHDRVIEAGECPSSSSGVVFQNYYGVPTASGATTNSIKDNVGTTGLPGTTSNKVNICYSTNAHSFPSTPEGYAQKNTAGRVAETYTDLLQTWYSYDASGRPVLSVQKFNDSDFGNPVKSIEYVYNNSTGLLSQVLYQSGTTTERVAHNYIYDLDLRLQEVTTAFGSSSATTQAKYFYYKTGNLKRKELGGNLQGVDYIYTINGQLKSINNPSLDPSKDPGVDGLTGGTHAGFSMDLFGEALDYHVDDYKRTGSNVSNSSTGGRYNGLIEAVRYKTRAATSGIDANGSYQIPCPGCTNDKKTLITGYSEELMNQYTYDGRNQLFRSVFGVFTNTGSGSFSTSLTQGSFDEFGGTSNNGITYDANGNITSLKRNTYNTSTSTQLLDNLSYSYQANTNKLSSVTDAVSASSFGDDFDATSGNNAFTYYANGTLKSSQAEMVSNIVYDVFGKVKTVTAGDNPNIATYYYDVSGKKIKTVYTNTGIASSKRVWYVYDLSGSLLAVYERDDAVGTTVILKEQPIYGLERIGTHDRSTGVTKYELTDHLGNVRVTFKNTSGVAEITSRADYYAFGGMIPGRNYESTPYRFNAFQGQEKAVSSRWVNYDLRMYNADLGRFISPDPMRQFHSPYLALANNPVSFSDPTGGYASVPSGEVTINDIERQGYLLFMMQEAERREPYYQMLMEKEAMQRMKKRAEQMPLWKVYEMRKEALYHLHKNDNNSYARAHALLSLSMQFGFYDRPDRVIFDPTDMKSEIEAYRDFSYRAGVAAYVNHASAAGYTDEQIVAGLALGLGEIVKDKNGSLSSTIDYDFTSNSISYLNVQSRTEYGPSSKWDGPMKRTKFYLASSGRSTSIEGVAYASIDGGCCPDKDYDGSYMKPASSYDYKKEVIPGKFSEDWNYIINGKGGTPITRYFDTFVRDWLQATNSEKSELLFAVAPFVRIGKLKISNKDDVFHRIIKPDILKASGNYSKVVGRNPDIDIINDKIILKGNGPFRGKSFNTGLDASDFFK